MRRALFAIALFIGFLWHALFAVLHEAACKKLTRRARGLSARAAHHKARAEFHAGRNASDGSGG